MLTADASNGLDMELENQQISGWRTARFKDAKRPEIELRIKCVRRMSAELE